jgi:phosphoadenosine phosphosulfate reductase
VHEIGSVASDHPGLALTVSFSGGKDSLVALELACRTGRKLTMLFSNTGLEFPETVAHVRATARERGLRLIEGGAGESFWENLPRFGLPAKDFRWCCKVCKLAPMTSLLAGHFRTGVLTVEGRRRRESFARQGIRLLEDSPFVPGQLNIEPIRNWTALEVWLYIRLRHLPYNPLYDADIERVGCWMCPATLESEFETLKRTHPALHSRWAGKLAEEGTKAGMDGRAVSAGAWRWKEQPPKMKELAARYRWKPAGARPGEPALSVAGGISPCLTGGFSLEANLSLPEPVPFERVANLLGTLGEVRYAEEMGVAIVRRGPLSAKLFESGQIVVTGPRTETVRPFLRELVGVVLRAARCSKCNLCLQSCRKNALIVREAPEVDWEKCDQCGRCAKACVLVKYADKMVARTE